MGQKAIDDASAEPDIKDNIMHSSSARRNKIRVLIVMFVAVVLGALGDISLSKGMRLVGSMEAGGTLNMLSAVLNIYVIMGVLLQLSFLILYLISLSWEELSYVLPLTAADYILVTIFAFFLLHEPVSPLRWAGSALVAIGIGLVART